MTFQKGDVVVQEIFNDVDTQIVVGALYPVDVIPKCKSNDYINRQTTCEYVIYVYYATHNKDVAWCNINNLSKLKLLYKYSQDLSWHILINACLRVCESISLSQTILQYCANKLEQQDNKIELIEALKSELDLLKCRFAEYEAEVLSFDEDANDELEMMGYDIEALEECLSDFTKHSD